MAKKYAVLVPILFTFSAIYCVQQAPLDTSYPEDQQGWVEEQEIEERPGHQKLQV